MDGSPWVFNIYWDNEWSVLVWYMTTCFIEKWWVFSPGGFTLEMTSGGRVGGENGSMIYICCVNNTPPIVIKLSQNISHTIHNIWQIKIYWLGICRLHTIIITHLIKGGFKNTMLYRQLSGSEFWELVEITTVEYGPNDVEGGENSINSRGYGEVAHIYRGTGGLGCMGGNGR